MENFPDPKQFSKEMKKKKANKLKAAAESLENLEHHSTKGDAVKLEADFSKIAESLPEREGDSKKKKAESLSHYVAPREEDEAKADISKPVVITKRQMLIGGAVAIVLAIVVSLCYIFLGPQANKGTPISIALRAGKNVKKNVNSVEWSKLTLPTDLSKGDLIRTGSDRRNVLVFPDESSVRLDDHTSIRINSVEQTKAGYKMDITLIAGAVYVTSTDATSVTVETKFLKTTPVGPRFAVIQKELEDLTEESIVRIVEGSALVVHAEDSSAKCTVKSGEQVSVSESALAKPRPATTDKWIDWNSTWNDYSKMPAAPKGQRYVAKKSLKKDTLPDDYYKRPDELPPIDGGYSVEPEEPAYDPAPVQQAPAQPAPRRKRTKRVTKAPSITGGSQVPRASAPQSAAPQAPASQPQPQPKQEKKEGPVKEVVRHVDKSGKMLQNVHLDNVNAGTMDLIRQHGNFHGTAPDVKTENFEQFDVNPLDAADRGFTGGDGNAGDFNPNYKPIKRDNSGYNEMPTADPKAMGL